MHSCSAPVFSGRPRRPAPSRNCRRGSIAPSRLAVLRSLRGYLLWLMAGPRTVGRGGWRVTLPCARLTLVQIGIGVLDLTAGALAMHALLPADPSIDFVTVQVIFVTAALL